MLPLRTSLMPMLASKPPRSTWLRFHWLRQRRVRGFVAGIAGVLAALVLLLLALAWEAMGKAASDERLRRMRASPQWAGEGFENPLPLRNDTWGMFSEALSSEAVSTPTSALPVSSVDAARFKDAPTSGLRVTWLGHSTTLIEIDGARFLTDPVWGERASPLSFVGPERWYPPPLPLADLPQLDAILISHDHYDHLDHPTIVALRDHDTVFVVPLGVAAHLRYWGVPEGRIVELDWWQETVVSGVRVVCSPARHASGRHLFDQNATLWAGYAMLGPQHRAYFSGDTGLFPEFELIGTRYGPFDVTMIEVGAYGQPWPDWHIGPEQALLAHRMLRGEVFLPIHWGLFNLAMHSWTEPIERTVAAAREQGVKVLAPRPGESVEPASAQTPKWWPDLPWQTAAEYPIESSGM